MAPEVRKDSNKKACLACQGEFSGDLLTCPNDGTVLTALVDDDLVGTVLDDRYEILGVIGGGGMGKVYRAKQRFINRLVAVKVLHKGSISSAETLKRFQLEAQAASQLSTPHIVTVFDSNVSKSGEPYMVMDYLEGESLDGILESQGALPAARALPIFIQVCEALAKAHAKGIVHRDIKPSNIVLVNEDGVADFVKIVDFGIAKILREGDAQTGLTRTGEIFGSPQYMSPEQWRGGKLDGRTDIYSLGAVMYRSLSGSPLFNCGDVLQLAYKHVQEMPPSIASLGLQLPGNLEAIVFKALAKDAEERFQSMQELREELAAVQNGLPLSDSGAAISTRSYAVLAHENRDSLNLPAVSTSTQEWLRDLTPSKMAATDGPGANQPRPANENLAKAAPFTALETSEGVLDRSGQGGALPANNINFSSNITFSSSAIKSPNLSSPGKPKAGEQTVQLVIPKRTLKAGVVAAVVIVSGIIGTLAFQGLHHDVAPIAPVPDSRLAKPAGINSNSSILPGNSAPTASQGIHDDGQGNPAQYSSEPVSGTTPGTMSPSGLASPTGAAAHAHSTAVLGPQPGEKAAAHAAYSHEKSHYHAVYTEKKTSEKNNKSVGLKKFFKKVLRKL